MGKGRNTKQSLRKNQDFDLFARAKPDLLEHRRVGSCSHQYIDENWRYLQKRDATRPSNVNQPCTPSWLKTAEKGMKVWLFPVEVRTRGFPAKSMWKMLTELGITGQQRRVKAQSVVQLKRHLVGLAPKRWKELVLTVNSQWLTPLWPTILECPM